MGNSIDNSDGNHVTAYQDVNPKVLQTMSEIAHKPGADALHEFTEAAFGARWASYKNSSISKASVNNIFYQLSHIGASPQSADVYRDYYDSNDQVTSIDHAVRAVYYVLFLNTKTIIQIYP